MISFAWSNGVGGLSLMKAAPGELGRREPIPENWKPDDSDVLITFDNEESVRNFIKNLEDVLGSMKEAMEEIGENAAEHPYGVTREYHKDGSFTEYKED